MGVHQRRDKTFYAKCDFEGCMHTEELKATSFWEAVDEAKRLGFKPAKDKDGLWVSFCTPFCKMCHMQGPIIIKKKQK